MAIHEIEFENERTLSVYTGPSSDADFLDIKVKPGARIQVGIVEENLLIRTNQTTFYAPIPTPLAEAFLNPGTAERETVQAWLSNLDKLPPEIKNNLLDRLLASDDQQIVG